MRISDWSSDVCSSDLTAARVAAGGVARLVIPEVQIHAWVAEIGGDVIDPENFDLEEIDRNPFFCTDPAAAQRWEGLMAAARKAGSSLGAVIEDRKSTRLNSSH